MFDGLQNQRFHFKQVKVSKPRKIDIKTQAYYI